MRAPDFAIASIASITAGSVATSRTRTSGRSGAGRVPSAPRIAARTVASSLYTNTVRTVGGAGGATTWSTVDGPGMGHSLVTWGAAALVGPARPLPFAFAHADRSRPDAAAEREVVSALFRARRGKTTIRSRGRFRLNG